MKVFIKLFALILFLYLGFQPSAVHAQTGLQSPSEFLGYELGSEWTPHYKVMNYFRYVAEQSPLVKTEKYGETYEGRELMLAYVASEDNINRLEEIRMNNLKRTGLADGEPSGENIAIIWLSYNVHGNEASSSEAAMKTIYELARPDNAETKKWLQSAVVIMDPMLNPDGRDRYVYWYKHQVGEQFNAHGNAREHHEPWPGGRTNHYYFDLNRDWAWLTQKESRQRIAEYQKWMPQVHVDFHEMGYTNHYFFPPAASPLHNAITNWQRKFQYTVGKNNAKYFDQNNWLYFTGEVYDLFYPSYGDTYPIFSGAIGMTYEQAGGGYAGLGIIKPIGDTLTLNDRLMHHFTTGMATIEASAKHADRLVEEFAKYFETSIHNPKGEYKTFVIKGDNNPDKLFAFFELLDSHNIKYGKAAEENEVEGYNYQTGEVEELRVTGDDYLVSTYQPRSVMARVLLEPRPQLEDSVTYDITAWNQFYAYGLDGFATTERLDVKPAEVPQRKVDNSFTGTPYAYIARWQDVPDIRLLADLLKHDINVRFAHGNFKIEDKMYEAGTLIITRSDNVNRADFNQVVQQIATAHNQQLNAVSTGFVQAGSDFGSSSVHYLEKPRVALISGRGTSSNMVGQIWHYFDQQIEYPVTLIGTDYFNRIDLHPYDVLILPSADYEDVLNEERMGEIKEWISAGGKLIAVGGANAFLAGKDGFSLEVKKGEEDEESSPNELLDTFGERQRESISSYNTGSIYKITMDETHPLAFGYDEDYFSIKLSADAYAYLKDGWNVGVAKEDAHVAGFVGYKAEEKLENTLVFGVQNMGAGSVVYMVDNPLFRAFWYNGKLLFGNAVFLVGQ
ncbi:MAG TPA: M14 metallopeptidase family protein [Balneolaceae bacterium]|nr:M14 metallopeptidase family protein [Balneolaceae bacterium]